ncbi:hypothetical protein RQP46_004604 [Phenoliferia psychrophenolica]
MATFISLSSELLAHLLKLSTRGETRKEQQRARFSFGLISRACFLATASLTDVYVAGPRQAECLISMIVHEQKRVTQEERKAIRGPGRTTRTRRALRIKRFSDIRRIRVTVDHFEIIIYLSFLLRLTSTNLSALELEIENLYGQFGDDADDEGDKVIAAWYEPLEAALGKMTGLQRLHITSLPEAALNSEMVVRLLIPLKALEVLHLDIIIFDGNIPPRPDLLAQLALPRLRELVVGERPSPDMTKTLVAASPTNLRTLHLSSWYTGYFPEILPLVPNLIHFSWTPDRQPLDEDSRDAVLTLLGAMTSLESLTIPLWTLGDYDEFYWETHNDDDIDGEEEPDEEDGWDLKPVDHTVFDVLATLPRLRTVTLVAQIGKVEESDVMSFIKALPSLRTLSIVSKRKRGWTPEEIERVGAAGEDVGVNFVYERDHF